jgi:hypothetical protein
VINHFGILVEDIDTAIEQYSNLAALPFCEPIEASFAHVDHGTHVEEPAIVRLTYSMGGPAYIELIEASGDGVWSPRHGYGFHHFGGYRADIEAAHQAAIARGAEPECVVRSPDGAHMLTYFAPGSLIDARIELLTEGMLPAWETWVGGGPPPGLA